METLNRSSSEVESASWRSKAPLFTGIAAGLGLALGIAGRIVRRRRAAKREVPAYILVEAC